MHGRVFSATYSRLDDVLSTALRPGDGGRVLLGVDGNRLALDDELAVLDLNGALEAAVNGVELEHVDHVVKGDERAVVGTIVSTDPKCRASERTRSPRQRRCHHEGAHCASRYGQYGLSDHVRPKIGRENIWGTPKLYSGSSRDQSQLVPATRR
jgi:hypothetical protein